MKEKKYDIYFENSVKVNNEIAQYTYDPSTGLLTIKLETIDNTKDSIITFQVQKA